MTSALAISCAGVVTPGRDDRSDGGPVAADTRVVDDAPGDAGTIETPRPAGRLCSVAGAGAPARAGFVVQAGPNVRIRWTDETSRDHRLAVSPSHRVMYPGSLAARASQVTASVIAQQGSSAPVESRALIDAGGRVLWERTEPARGAAAWLGPDGSVVEAWQAGEQWVMRRTAPDRSEARLERWRPVGFVGAAGAFAVQSGWGRELRLGWWTAEASAPRAVEVAPGTIASWAMVLADRLVYPVVRAAGVALAVAAPDRTAWVELPGAAPDGQLRVVSATESGWLGLIEAGSMRGWAVDVARGESRAIAAAPPWSLVDDTGVVVRSQIDGADKRFVRGTAALPGAFAPDQIVELDSRGGTLIVRGRYASEALFVPEFGRERVQTLLLRLQIGVSRTLRSEALSDAIAPLVTLDGTCATWTEPGPTPNTHRVSVLDVLSGDARQLAFESEHPLRVAWLE